MTVTSHVDSDISSELSEFVGYVLSAILYGAYLVINILSINALLANQNITRSRRLFYIAFGTMLLILNTIALAFWTFLGQMAWIVYRNNPGPSQYYSNHYRYWYMHVGNGSQGVANLLADCLIIYRCYVIFNRKLRYMILPFIFLLSFIGVPILFFSLTNLPFLPFKFLKNPFTVSFIIAQIDALHSSQSDIWKFNGLNIFCTIGVNILVTLMISVRLFLVSRKAYATVIAIMVESAVLFTATGITISVVSFMGSPISEGMLPVFIVTGGISAQLIILRLALGPRAPPKSVKQKHVTSSLDHPFLTKFEQPDSNDVAEAAAFVGDSDIPMSEWHVASHKNTYMGDLTPGNTTHQMGTMPATKGVLTQDIEASLVLEDNNRSLAFAFTSTDVYM